MLRLLACFVACCLIHSSVAAGIVYYLGTTEGTPGQGNRDTILSFDNRNPRTGRVTGGVGVHGTWGDTTNHSQTFSIDALPEDSYGFSLLANVKGGWEILDWMVVYVQNPWGRILDAAWYITDTPIYGVGNSGKSNALFAVSYDADEWQSLLGSGNQIGVSASFYNAKGGESFAIAPLTPAAVPEPSSIALLALGFTGLGVWRYKRGSYKRKDL